MGVASGKEGTSALEEGLAQRAVSFPDLGADDVQVVVTLAGPVVAPGVGGKARSPVLKGVV